MSWQARLHLNKRWKCYSLYLGNFESGRRYVNICFLTPAQSRSGLNTFTDRHIQIHIKQITRSEILRQYRKITLRVIFISYQSNCQHKKVNTDNLSASTSTTAQIFDANQILLYQINRYRIVCKKKISSSFIQPTGLG